MSVYNNARTLGRALDSILAQEGTDFEFIVVDDGSTDESGSIIAQYAQSDPRIRVLTQTNQGLTKALIRGCAEAKGEFIARQDADDFSLAGRLRGLADLLSSDSRIVFASSWAYVVGPNGELLSEETRPADPAESTANVLNGRRGPPGHGSVMFRRSVYERVGGYRTAFTYGQDRDLWLRLAEAGLLAYRQEFLYAYECSVNSLSVTALSAQRRLARIMDECRTRRRNGQDESGLLAQAAQVRASDTRSDPTAGSYLIAGYLRKRRDPRAAGYYGRILRRRPDRLDAWCGLAVSLLTSRRAVRRNVGPLGASKE